MKSKGVGRVIIVIVVLIVVIGGIGGGYLALSSDGGEGGSQLADLPKYSGSGNWNDVPSNLTPSSENIDFSAYQVKDANVQDVYDWFKTQMTEWTLKDNQEPVNQGENTIGALVYENGETALGIIIINGPDYPGTCYIQGIGPQEVINLEQNDNNKLMSKSTKVVAW